jgi:pimeloyl-ACP methyl ester carboxylesterase
MGALAEIWDPLFGALQQAWETSERPVWVTGHSLGGALALLAAWRLQRQFIRQFIPVHEVVTFGAPMVGNAAAAHAFQREFPGKIFRYVNIEDPVPLLPMVSLIANSYAHCLNEVRLQGANPKAVAHALGRLGQTAVEGLLSASLADEVWGLVKQRIDAHLLPDYNKRLIG